METEYPLTPPTPVYCSTSYSLPSQTDPITGQIDLDLITTGAGQQQRKLRGDLKREILHILDSEPRSSSSTGLRYSSLMTKLEGQSSIPVNASEFNETIKTLVAEGVIKVVGEREKRTIRKIVD